MPLALLVAVFVFLFSASPLRAGDVPLYKVFEARITNTRSYTNKFADVTLSVTYHAPSGRQIPFFGFYDGDGAGGQTGDVWKIRCLADEVGSWTYSYRWSDDPPEVPSVQGSFDVVAAGAGRGPLLPYAPNPHWLAYNGREPVFLKSFHFGWSLTGLPLDWTVQNVYSKLLGRGYNHLQILQMLPLWWSDQKPPDAPAGQQNEAPLWHDTPLQQNLSVWTRMEQHVAWLNDRSVGIYFFMGFDPKGEANDQRAPRYAQKRWMAMETTEKDVYVRYVAARLAPYANIAGWNYTWETDGTTGETELMDLLIRYDPWAHLRGYYDDNERDNSFDNPKYTMAAIGNGFYFNGREGPGSKSSASHYLATMDAYRNKPVYMVEGEGLWRPCWEATEVSIPRAGWAVTLAGGSFTWSDTATAPGLCDYDDPTTNIFDWPAANPVADRLDVLYGVMTRDVAFHRMSPHQELLSGCPSAFDRDGPVPFSPCYALAEPGRQYLVHKEEGGTFGLTVAPGSYLAQWVDTRTGARRPVGGGTITGTGANVSFTTPAEPTDWLLVLTTSVAYVSDLAYTAVRNGFGPVERDRSNGEQFAGDGHTLTLNGQPYAKGLGAHADSEIRVPLDGAFTRFMADVGIDDEEGLNGSAQFEVWADGALLFRSDDLTANSPTVTIDKDVTGKQELRLLVTEGSVGCCDHADWANARLVRATPAPAPPRSAYVSDLAWAELANGFGPVERDTSNGEDAGRDGHLITLNAVTYAKGLGAHAPSEVRMPLDGGYARFMADVGIDDEEGLNGSAQFEVRADGVLLFQSEDMTATSATRTIDVDVTGRQDLRLIVTEGSVGCCDHADWAGARLLRGGAPTAGLAANWRFDEGTGTSVADSSGHGHPAGLQGGTTWVTDGRFGGALAFDGTHNDVPVQAPPVVGNAAAFTVAVWVRTSSSQTGVVYSEENAVKEQNPSLPKPFVYLSINENDAGDAEFGIMDDNGTWGGVNIGPSGLNDGRWHLLVGVQRSKSDRQLFVDGVPGPSSGVTLGTVSLDKASIGRFDLATSHNLLQGVADDIRIYNRALAAEELQSLRP